MVVVLVYMNKITMKLFSRNIDPLVFFIIVSFIFPLFYFLIFDIKNKKCEIKVLTAIITYISITNANADLKNEI